VRSDRDVLASGAESPTEQDLVAATESLNEPRRIELLALT